MQQRFWVMRIVLFAALLTICLVSFVLFEVSMHTAVHAAPRTRALPASSISNVLSSFYANPNDSGTFDIASTTTPVFTESFASLVFNPPTTFQFCNTSTGIDENSRPFTNLMQNADGSCTLTIAQGNGQQTGVGGLFSFESEFLAELSVPQAGQFDLMLYADDGWMLGVGPDSAGDQPAYVAGPMNTAPADGKSPFAKYPLLGANNVPSSPLQSTVTVSFPAAGTYPLELDYTECCGGQLTLVMGDLSASTVTPTPLPSTTPMPGGTWMTPSSGSFTVTGDTFHFAAHVNRLNSWDPPIDHVNFTAWFLGVNPNVWVIACQSTTLISGTTDVFECDWTLSPNIANGPVTVSFDVYDTAGNRGLAPNGTLQGTINRPMHAVLLAPMPAGTTVEIIHGYNDPLPTQTCPAPGNGIDDHCMNQQYGLDLVPVATSSDPHPSQDILAPADGTVARVQNDCLGLRLSTGDVNLTICHFASFKANLQGTSVTRGTFLGTMTGHIHMNIDDRYHDLSHSQCSPGSARTCLPVPFNGGYFAIEEQSFDPGFDQNNNPLQNQYGCPTGQNCILIVSTNAEIKS